MPTLTAPGIGSSLDVNGIVGQLMAAERRPLALYTQQEARVQAKLSAFGTLRGALASLQNAVRALAGPERFRLYRADSGDSSILTASAGTGAVAGTYGVEVIALAQSHKLRSAANGSGATVGSGSLTFQFGSYDSGANSFTLNADKAARTVTIAAGQDTLAGIRDAVNAAQIGVAASLVNDGSGERLVLASTDTGVANSLRITVTDDDATNTDASGLSALAYDPTAAAGSGKNLTQSVAALDASLKLDGIAITKATNTVSDAIGGVALNLVKAAAGTTLNVTVARDTAAVKASVQGFVKAYNDLAAQLRSLTAYDAQSKKAGTLQGDAVALALGARLRGELGAAVTGAPETMARLSQLGIAAQKDGTLALDAAKFDAAAGAGLEDIAGLFARYGSATQSASVSYLGASTATRTGSYAVALTQVATRGTLAGSAAAGLTVTAGVDDSATFAVDGVSASVTLAAGTYASASALAAELQTRLNGAAALRTAGISVSVSQSGGVLTVASARYGGDSAVTVQAGTGATGLFGAAPTASGGVDAAGTINGVTASADGQYLTGASGDASDGLRLRVAPPVAGSLGSVAFRIGHAARLDELIGQWLDDEGSLAGRLDGLNTQLKELGRRQSAFNDRLVEVEKRYRAQFTALDTMLARMQSTSSYLGTQLASLSRLQG